VTRIHLFTIAGIPVSVSPWYLVLLYSFARGDLQRGMIWAVGVTLGLLVHEMGHALVARYLRHQPSIMLHGFGGLTSRERTGRDVEEAVIIAAGPAAGLALGLSVAGLWYLFLHAMATSGGRVLMSRFVFESFNAILFPCITWNVLNLIPLWPLDGGQLFRLGAMRMLGAQRADKVTHGLALALIALCFAWLGRSVDLFSILLLGLLAVQNVRALRGQVSSGVVHRPNEHGQQLIAEAQQALAQGRWKEAARLAHQARAITAVSPPQLDEIWQVLGVANTELGEHEEALSYLRRAPPTPAVRAATEACLVALEQPEEMAAMLARWQAGARDRHMGRWLGVVLSFIALSLALVFGTPVSQFFL
jgi:Zn-dependent protease